MLQQNTTFKNLSSFLVQNLMYDGIHMVKLLQQEIYTRTLGSTGLNNLHIIQYNQVSSGGDLIHLYSCSQMDPQHKTPFEKIIS